MTQPNDSALAARLPNGYRSRQLKTRVGTLHLLVPMDREGTFKAELFDRYQRSEKALVLSLMEMYLGA